MKKSLLKEIERNIKAKVAGLKASEQAKYVAAVKGLGETQEIIANLELIRLELGLSVSKYAQELEVARCGVKLSNSKGQAYRNLVSLRTLYKLPKLRNILVAAVKVQKYHSVEKNSK